MAVVAFCARPTAGSTQRAQRTQRIDPVFKNGPFLCVLGVLCVDPNTLSPLERADDLPRGEGARSTVQAGAWMGARSAEKQAIDRRTVARAAEERPRDEPLIERELAVEDVPAGHAVRALEIERRDHLSREDGRVEPRCVLRDGAGR